VTTTAAAGTRRHTGIYPAEPEQVRVARAALTGAGNWGIDGDTGGRVAWAWLRR
jgi:hypothetical protein